MSSCWRSRQYCCANASNTDDTLDCHSYLYEYLNDALSGLSLIPSSGASKSCAVLEYCRSIIVSLPS